ncbi:MAG: hypothetical protein C0511_18825, partial [Hyphomicrobium sp.]
MRSEVAKGSEVGFSSRATLSLPSALADGATSDRVDGGPAAAEPFVAAATTAGGASGGGAAALS